MRRGEIWTVSGGKDYAGKPRPAVIVQDDAFDATDSVTVCAFATDPTEAGLIRLPVEANERSRLRLPCRLMVDKITTVPKVKLREHVGRLDDEDVLRLNRAMLVFLGLAARRPAAEGGRRPGLAWGQQHQQHPCARGQRRINPEAAAHHGDYRGCSVLCLPRGIRSRVGRTDGLWHRTAVATTFPR